ncbi:major intrinsic protein [Bifidobacterium actinocoloniiforme DSM 22766]|uniref:Major intrinsic protein n=2 Tax=Bifidobacterium actinocoloniiforme TaxID=638619 RepID=A0A086Z0G5_9BIFI|nr:hypothetical protein AB656_02175 [Bifidobacterium actinocoloniiforme DSM 22766]KFI40015.1 major intrinsic protein [Bifidobacterium actinocoloniiforme DSM 22766]
MDPDTETTAAQLLKPTTLAALRAVAEFTGSFLICFAVYAVCSWGRIPAGTSALEAATTWALAFLAAGSIFGKFCGAHFNPAVTFAAMFTAQIGWIQGLSYILAQFLGAIAAGGVVVSLLPLTTENDGRAWLTVAVNGFDKGSPSADMLGKFHLSFNVTLAIVAELIASLIVVAVAITSLRDDGRPKRGHVWRSAMAYGVAVMITYPVTGAGLNPARSTGIALFAHGTGLEADPISQLPIFIVCPLMAGAVVGLVVILCHMVLDGARAKLDTAPESSIDMPAALVGGADAPQESVHTEAGDEGADAHDTKTDESRSEDQNSAAEPAGGAMAAESGDSSQEQHDAQVGGDQS